MSRKSFAKSKSIAIVGIIVFMLSLFLVVIAAQQRQQTQTTAAAPGPLKVNSANPRYFADSSGKPVYLTGAYSWNFSAMMSDSQATEYLNYIVANNQNFIRVPTNDNTFWESSTPNTPFNEAYFNTLKSRVSMANDKGVYVAVTIFGHVTGPPFDDIAYNESYARKVVDTVGMFSNVLFEVGNELDTSKIDNGTVGSFSTRIVNVINEQQNAKGFAHHPVGISDFKAYGDWGVQHPEVVNIMLNSPADFIQPGWSAVQTGGVETLPDYGGKKVVIADSDHFQAYQADPRWVWKTMTRGNSTAVLDGNFFYPEKSIPDDPNFTEGAKNTFDARVRIGDTRTYALKMNLEKALPDAKVSSTGYALANPGVEYLVYQPASGAFTVNLGAGTYDVEWFDATARKSSTAGTVNGGSTQTFTPPFTGDAVLYLRVSPRIVRKSVIGINSTFR